MGIRGPPGQPDDKHAETVRRLVNGDGNNENDKEKHNSVDGGYDVVGEWPGRWGAFGH